MKRALAIMIVVGVIIALAAVISAIWALYTLVDGLSRSGVNWWAVVSTCLLIPAALAGHWTGRVEARGYAHGADKVIDKMTGLVERVSTIRESARPPARSAAQAPAWQVSPPAPPLLSYRTVDRDSSDNL